MSDDALYGKVMELIRAGRLPDRLPERVWGGAGLDGIQCAVCDATMGHTDVVLEVEVAGAEGMTYPQFHVACFSVLERALRDLEAAPAPRGRFGRENAA